MKIIKEAGNMTPIVGAQPLFWPLTPPPSLLWDANVECEPANPTRQKAAEQHSLNTKLFGDMVIEASTEVPRRGSTVGWFGWL